MLSTGSGSRGVLRILRVLRAFRSLRRLDIEKDAFFTVTKAILAKISNFSQSEVKTQPKVTVYVFRALMPVECIHTAFTLSFDYVPLLLLANKIHSKKILSFFCCAASL